MQALFGSGSSLHTERVLEWEKEFLEVSMECDSV